MKGFSEIGKAVGRDMLRWAELEELEVRGLNRRVGSMCGNTKLVRASYLDRH